MLKGFLAPQIQMDRQIPVFNGQNHKDGSNLRSAGAAKMKTRSESVRAGEHGEAAQWWQSQEPPCTWARLGLFGFLVFFPSFIVFFGRPCFRKKRAKCYYSPEFGQILLLTAYSLFNAKRNDLSQGHFPPPKTL